MVNYFKKYKYIEVNIIWVTVKHVIMKLAYGHYSY